VNAADQRDHAGDREPVEAVVAGELDEAGDEDEDGREEVQARKRCGATPRARPA